MAAGPPPDRSPGGAGGVEPVVGDGRGPPAASWTSVDDADSWLDRASAQAPGALPATPAGPCSRRRRPSLSASSPAPGSGRAAGSWKSVGLGDDDARALLAAALAARRDTRGPTDLDHRGTCRALLSEGETAEGLYQEAISRLGRTQLRPDLARAHLLYGEWLRRQDRRLDARQQLRTAYDMLAAIGMAAFAERARRELIATGEKVRKRTIEAPDDLTAQEALIARLARDGRSNPEISAQLFISTRTVEWHLRKVYAKLGVSSRGQLRRVLADPNRPAAAGLPSPGPFNLHRGLDEVMVPLFRARPVAGQGSAGRAVRRGRGWAAAAWLGRVRRRSRLPRRARRTRPRRAGHH